MPANERGIGMGVALITGAAGLVGSSAARLFAGEGFDVVGVDNDLRRHFFGPASSTQATQLELRRTLPRYRHRSIDIRDEQAMEALFREFASDIQVVVHAAAQPSHDWAAQDPRTDFSVNALATLSLLELARRHAARATFIYMSTNKVYGDSPNRLPLVEQETRFELSADHPYSEHGIDEGMSIDQTLHSLFGASKLSADVTVQEYGRYFGMATACFRGGCITGPMHAGAQGHGFLSYLVRCSVRQMPYSIFGYHGKQVRDNLHADDLAQMFWHFHQNPLPGRVYNVGGGRRSNCSVREAIAICDELTGTPLQVDYVDQPRTGDHLWWISDTRRFEGDYPHWRARHNLPDIVTEIYDRLSAGD